MRNVSLRWVPPTECALRLLQDFLRAKQLSPVVLRWYVWRRIQEPLTPMPDMFIKCDMNVLMR